MFSDSHFEINYLDADQVEQLIREGFGEGTKRCIHILEVAKRVKQSAVHLNTALGKASIDVNEAYCAALLHDVGYLEPLHDTGFHPIDGARHLERKGFPRLAKLIICHSNSPEQAQLKGLEEIEVSQDIIAKLITYWDVQIKQGGKRVAYKERIADVLDRYGEESEQYQAHKNAEPRIQQILNEFSGVLKDL